jgi:hypothetical protein
MRLKKWQPILINPAQGADLFARPQAAAFIRYVGKLQAKVYVRDEGFSFVPLSRIEPDLKAVSA